MNIQKKIYDLEKKYPTEKDYLQASKEILFSLEDLLLENPVFENHNIIDRLLEPDRILNFKVVWTDDKGKVRVNRGYRIQFNNILGPYKGELRFHAGVNINMMKFLGLEQVFKNALTGLPIGGGVGGADFDPKGKSQNEIMRFCQAYMLELKRFIGSDLDIPDGGLGVGVKEIGYLYGMYKKLSGEHTGSITGKSPHWGGSLMRPEATGYGVVYFAQQILRQKGEEIKNKTVAISGYGNVAWGVAKKVTELGGKVITLSAPDGYIRDSDGISDEKIDYMRLLRSEGNDMIRPYTYEFSNAEFHKNKKPWEVKCDIAIPCAIHNELRKEDALQLVKNDCLAVVEGADMASSPEAIEIFNDYNVAYAPGKAANAGGVVVSALEMVQNAMKLNWQAEEVDKRLYEVMQNIHNNCSKYGNNNEKINYAKGANIAAFIRVANAMIDTGIL